MGGVAWTKEEDHLLKKCIQRHGVGKWQRIPLLAGLNRCPKSCRLRWVNYLRPNIRRGSFAEEEVDLIIRLHQLLGNRWSLIAGRLPGRTGNDIKNFWNCHLSKKLINNADQEHKVEVLKPQGRYRAANLQSHEESSLSTPLILQGVEVDEQEIRMLQREESKENIPGHVSELGTMMSDWPIDFHLEQVRVTDKDSSIWDFVFDDLIFDMEII